MRTKKIIKRFTFENKNREKITLGPNTRLPPEESNLQLLLTSGGYPTDSDLFVKTEVFNPKSVVTFTGFDVYAVHQVDFEKTPYSSLGFRLSDETNEFFWNGSNWEINIVDWNTEDEVSANIADYPTTSKKLQIIINLVTTSASYTPIVDEIRVLYESIIDFQDDLIYNSIVPALRTVNPIADFPIVMTSTTDQIDLNNFPLQTPYKIVDVDSCFNYTDDPEKATDIFSSYNTGTKVITLTGAVDSGKTVWIKFIYEPIVAVATDQEYAEVSEVPAIHILNIDTLKNALVKGTTAVRNKGAGTAVKLTRSRQKTFEFTVAVLTSSQVDQQRLQDKIRDFFDNNIAINFSGLDVEHTMYISNDFSTQTGIKDLATYTGIFRFVVKDVIFYIKTQDLYTIEQFLITGDLDVTVN